MNERNLNGSLPLCLIITAEYSVQKGNVKSTTLSLCEVIVIPVAIMSISCKLSNRISYSVAANVYVVHFYVNIYANSVL